MLNKKNIILIGLLVVFVLIAFYFYGKKSEVQSSTEDANLKEATELVIAVRKLIVLPDGEVPVIATVSDPEELKGQPFFTKAKTGDKVLLYPQSKKAFLYDPVANKILEVAPINLDSGN